MTRLWILQRNPRLNLARFLRTKQKAGLRLSKNNHFSSLIILLLKEKLQSDIKEALKAGNAEKRMVLSMVMSAVKNREFDKRARLSKSETDPAKLEEASKLNDEEIIEVLSSEIKKRKDSVEQYNSGGRPELAEKEQKEIDMLSVYMPEQMSEEEIRAEVKSAIRQLADSTGAAGPKDIGKVIGAVMAKIKGKADGTFVSKIVKEELGS